MTSHPKIFYDEQSLVRTLTRLCFSFPTNGSSSPLSTTILGRGVTSVARTATGTYQVTLQDYWHKVIAAKVHLALATPALKVAQIKGAMPGSALTFYIVTLNSDTGAAADIAAATGNLVSCRLLLSNSSFGAGL